MENFDYILCPSDIIEIRKSYENMNQSATSFNSAKLEDTSVTQNDFQRWHDGGWSPSGQQKVVTLSSHDFD